MLKAELLERTLKEIDHAVDDAIDQVLDVENQDHLAHPKIFKLHSKHFKKKIEEKLVHFKKSFARGYELILDQAFHLSEKTGIPAQDFELKISPQLDEHAYKTILVNALKEKTPLQCCYAYTGDMMAAIYELAVELYKDKKYTQSSDVLQFLITLNPYVCWFWQLLGRIEQAQHRWKEALYIFEIAIGSDPENLECYEDAIKCCLQAGNYEEGVSILDRGLAFIKASKAVKKHEALKVHLKEMKTYVNSLIKKE